MTVHKKTPIWNSICTPVAPSLLISLGHSPRLGGHNFRLGGAQAVIWGAQPRYAPPWRQVCLYLVAFCKTLVERSCVFAFLKVIL